MIRLKRIKIFLKRHHLAGPLKTVEARLIIQSISIIKSKELIREWVIYEKEKNLLHN